MVQVRDCAGLSEHSCEGGGCRGADSRNVQVAECWGFSDRYVDEREMVKDSS